MVTVTVQKRRTVQYHPKSSLDVVDGSALCPVPNVTTGVVLEVNFYGSWHSSCSGRLPPYFFSRCRDSTINARFSVDHSGGMPTSSKLPRRGGDAQSDVSAVSQSSYEEGLVQLNKILQLVAPSVCYALADPRHQGREQQQLHSGPRRHFLSTLSRQPYILAQRGPGYEHAM